MGVITYRIKTRNLFSKLKKSKKTLSFLDIFTILSLQRPRGISQRGAGCKIHVCAKPYYLGRPKVVSSVATDFGPSTILLLICFVLL